MGKQRNAGKASAHGDGKGQAPPLDLRAASAPNVLTLVLDDVGSGWADTFGGLVETPNLTRLVRNGLGYVNHHTTALDPPTRACLLTGRNHQPVGLANLTELATVFPGHAGRQPQNKAAIAAMLHEHGYSSFALGKWHNTPPEETGAGVPSSYERWPTGPVFGFDRFYGFFGGDSDQSYPTLYLDREPIDQPSLPERGYHLSENLTDRAISFIANHESVDPEKPWLCHFAFGACQAPHRVAADWSDKYKGVFDMGWDAYRELVLERQKKLGVVAPHTELPPTRADAQTWDALSAEQQRLVARMAEVYAGFLSHADAQIGRVIDFLERTGDIDDTLIFVLVGDGGASGAGTLDKLAGDTPYQLCKQYTRFGGARNPLIVHWPKGIEAKGQWRPQLHHVIDVVPTILAAIGAEAPATINGVHQEPIEGVPMNYSFDDAKAPTNHRTQYFETLDQRAIVDGNWKAATSHGRTPSENEAAWSFAEDHWELYDLDKDPSECHDLMAGRDARDLDDPMTKKLIELVSLWWAEARRYGVRPLDDRFVQRSLARAGLADDRTKYRFFPGAVRIPEDVAPDTKNRSWAVDADVEIPPDGVSGPIVVMGGDTAGWSLYVRDCKPMFCHNMEAQELTYIRGAKPLPTGRHRIRYEFEKRGRETFGAGGVGRLFVDGQKVAEGEIPRTAAFGYSLDETFDVGCDKGAPVTDEYPPLASFTGKIIHVDVDLKPDLTRDVQRHHAPAPRTTLLRD